MKQRDKGKDRNREKKISRAVYQDRQKERESKQKESRNSVKIDREQET